MVNTEFDKRVALIRQVQSGEAVPTSKLLEEGKDILKREGLHPQQVPATQEEAMKFFARQREWSDLYLDSVPETNSYDYDGSISTEYPENTKNPHHIAYEILKGRQTASIVPTLGGWCLNGLGKLGSPPNTSNGLKLLDSSGTLREMPGKTAFASSSGSTQEKVTAWFPRHIWKMVSSSGDG
jgi:hypothetical protein